LHLSYHSGTRKSAKELRRTGSIGIASRTLGDSSAKKLDKQPQIGNNPEERLISFNSHSVTFMPEIITCPKCQRRLQLPEQHLDAVVECPSCREHFTAREASAIRTTPKPTNIPTLERADTRNEGDERRGDSSPWDPRARRPRMSELPPPKPSRTGWYIVLGVLGIGVPLIALAGFGMVVLATRTANRAPRPVGTLPPWLAQQNGLGQMRDVRGTVRDDMPQDQKDLAKELLPVFDNLMAYSAANNVNQLEAMFDIDRAADAGAAQMAEAAQPGKSRSDLLLTIRLTVRKVWWDDRTPGEGLTAYQIRQVKKLNADELVVILRQEHENGMIQKTRWWLSRKNGTWRFYDTENLEIGLRFSSSCAFTGQGKATDVSKASSTIIEAQVAVAVHQDADTAENKLRQVEKTKLPALVDAFRWLTLARVHHLHGRSQESLQAAEQAGRLEPDWPSVDFRKARALNQMKQYDKALTLMQAYRNVIGDDALVCHDIGVSLSNLNRFPEARDYYRKALDLRSGDAAMFQNYLWSLNGDEEDSDDVGTRFAKLDNLHDNFDKFAADCERRHVPQLLERLAVAMRKIDPEYAPVDYSLACCKARQGQAEEAAALFKAAMVKGKDKNKREEYVTGFVTAMAAAGKSKEAYAVAPDATVAFRILAAEAMKGYQLDELQQLVALHGKEHADDPLLALYQAEIYVREERFALAEKTFAAALAKPLDDETLKPFRGSRVLARFRTGEPMAAYRDIGPRQETFLQLAGLLFEDEDDVELQSLLDTHAKNDAGDIDVPCYRYRLKIRQNHMAEGVALFKAVLDKKLTKEKREEIVNDFLSQAVNAGKTLEGYQAAPDAKKAFKFLMQQLSYQNDRLEDMPRLIAAHREKEPSDPWLAYYQGEIHLKAQAWDKAAQVLGEGLKKAPKDLQDTFRGRFVFAMYKAGQGLKAYEETEPRDKTFTELADLLTGDKNGTELAALVKAHRLHAGDDDPDVLFYDALAHVLMKQPAETAALVQKAVQKQAIEWRRTRYTNRYLWAMEETDQALPAYRTAADKSAAFEVLAARLMQLKKDKELATLLEEHGKTHGDEPSCQFYTGELHLLHNDAKQAEPHLAAALAKCPPLSQYRYRAELMLARVKAGNAVAAYRDANAGPTPLESVAGLCVQEKDAKQLQAVLEIHRQAHPDDPNLTMWDLEVLWLNHDFEGALKLLTERREDYFDLPSHRWKADDYRVRCLVKLKRTKEAIREADGLAKKRYGNRVVQILAHAAGGDVAQTLAVMEKQRPQPYLLKACYKNADLGPILRTEPFKEFRAKFPEPKDSEVPDEDDWDEQ
jgi:tetratricopeptide (TPR) repeat protein